jgi:transposase-like protein
MKCPHCWTEKAYVRKAKSWEDALLYCLLMRPMKCHHCYRKFNVSWFATLGKQAKRPIRTNTPERSLGPSYAAQHRVRN